MQIQLQRSPSKARREVSEYLTESTEGMYLAGNHARMIWQGNKSLIVKSVNFKQALGKVFYVIGANDCYGAIKIKSINEITLSKFRELEGKHRITQKECKEWFAGKKVLYAYEFDMVQKFDLPKRVSVPQEIKTFMKEVKFLSDYDLVLVKKEPELIESVAPFQSFNLMEPAKRFCDERELLDYLFGGG